VYGAELRALDSKKPDVLTLAELFQEVEEYPDVVKEPAPICKRRPVVPFELTPLNITVIRFTQEGIPVKSMLVPDVLATAVPDVIALLAPLTTIVPVPAGTVTV
jgi:hypothetical protein